MSPAGIDILHTPREMRAWSRFRRAASFEIGCVPTMGALHEGHYSLMRASVKENDATVVTLFVNPAQFGPGEDLDRYPRTWDEDVAGCVREGVAAIYAPDTAGMYPPGYATYIEVERLADHLCGASRPGHFRGVATVVAKLLNAVEPDRAYFGQKDAQQCAIIRRMVQDLDFGVDIVEMPIVRDADGLALSSRNRYLSPDERQHALALPKALAAGAALIAQGGRSAAQVKAAVRDGLAGLDVEYVELADADTVQPLDYVAGRVLLAAAVRVGAARLIDNVKCEVPPS